MKSKLAGYLLWGFPPSTDETSGSIFSLEGTDVSPSSPNFPRLSSRSELSQSTRLSISEFSSSCLGIGLVYSELSFEVRSLIETQ